ncbi:hypothetical protein AJ87_31620 [Rhizobium yanglingense]|nr:hypothetical protein AJ87_31620 [Rhizobium yanglingense]
MRDIVITLLYSLGMNQATFQGDSMEYAQVLALLSWAIRRCFCWFDPDALVFAADAVIDHFIDTATTESQQWASADHHFR